MKEVDRRLSLYSIPACDGRSCPALIEGVFEEKDVNGVYKVVKRVSVEGNTSYGEVQIADIETGKAKSVEVGKNKKALAIYWSDLHQGIDVGGEWLLEYSDLKLKKLSQYKLYESNVYKVQLYIDKNNIDKDGYYQMTAR